MFDKASATNTYTAAQQASVQAKRDAALVRRTTGRAPKTVPEAVQKLKELVEAARREELVVVFGWMLNGTDVTRQVYRDRMVSRHDGPAVTKLCQAFGYSEFLEGRALVLNYEGLWYGAAAGGHAGSSTAFLRPVSEDAYPEVVRKYQLFAPQLQFLLDQLKVAV